MKEHSLKKYAYPLGVCILFLLIFAGLYLTKQKKAREPLSRTGFLLDTVITVTLYDHQSEEILDRAFSLCSEYEKKFSPTLAESDIYRMNHRPAGENSFTPDREVLSVIETGLAFSEETGGAFDITVEPLSRLWDFKSGKNEIPPAETLAKAAAHVGYEKVEVRGDSIFFADPETEIDPGAIAKGFIADRMKEQLIGEGVKSAIINLGGNILCLGRRPDGDPFGIAVRKPEKDTSEIVCVVPVDDLSVVTSGIYERGFEKDGIYYHHILDPDTGIPVRNGLRSVTIIGPSSMICDALSTSVFSLGEEEGLRFLSGKEGYAAYLIREDGTFAASANAPETAGGEK